MIAHDYKGRGKVPDMDHPSITSDQNQDVNLHNEEMVSSVKTTRKKLEQKRQERESLMAKVPTVDGDGISYTKQQIRRMRKRVKRGLDPVETPEEISQRLQNEAKLRKEEEAELAGMLAVPKISFNGQEANDEEEMEEEQLNETGDDDENIDRFDESADDKRDERDDPYSYEKKRGTTHPIEVIPRKKKKRSKEVPSDYVCSACNNRHESAHWIYDCPDKRTVRGTNQISKKSKGIQNPSDCKLFVSGLPFDCKASDVVELFQKHASNVSVQHCKLIKFADTGRCKGQAYVTFENAEDAKRALQLNGETIPNAVVTKAKDESISKEPKRKELKLKVSKVLNRFQTKHQKVAS